MLDIFFKSRLTLLGYFEKDLAQMILMWPSSKVNFDWLKQKLSVGGVCYRVNFVNCLIQTLWVNLKYLGTYDHWVEPSFPYNVGTFLKEYLLSLVVWLFSFCLG